MNERKVIFCMQQSLAPSGRRAISHGVIHRYIAKFPPSERRPVWCAWVDYPEEFRERDFPE